MASATCYACGEAAEPEEGQCAFCVHRLCGRHTIRTLFYGEWVSWCQPCRDRYEADRAAHRAGYEEA